MAKKKKKEIEGPGGQWIVNYSDMVTLLLCFFVALFDTTEVDPAQMAAMISSLNNIGMGASREETALPRGRARTWGILSCPFLPWIGAGPWEPLCAGL